MLKRPSVRGLIKKILKSDHLLLSVMNQRGVIMSQNAFKHASHVQSNQTLCYKEAHLSCRSKESLVLCHETSIFIFFGILSAYVNTKGWIQRLKKILPVKNSLA